MMASAPYSSAIAVNRAQISATAASQEICSNSPDPLGPTRRIGWTTRSSWYTRFSRSLTFAHSPPRVNGCSGSPRTPVTISFSTVTSTAHASGQSWAHVARTTRVPASCNARAIGAMGFAPRYRQV